MVIPSRLPLGMPSLSSLLAAMTNLAIYFLVNFFGIEDAFANDFPVGARALAEKATLIAFMAGGAADLMDLKQDRVGVAIDERVFDFLKIALTLRP